MKRSFMKVLLSFVLLLAVFAMAGCGKKNSDSVKSIDKNAIYKESPLNISIPSDMDVSGVQIANNRIYGNGYSYSSTTESQVIFSCALDGSDYKSFSIKDANAWIDSIIVSEDGKIYVLYSTYVEESSADSYDYNSFYYVCSYDADGNQLAKKDMTENFEWAQKAMVLNGDLLILADSKAFFMDESLNIKKTVDLDDSGISDVYQLKDGTYVAMVWGNEGEVLKTLDIETLELKDEISTAVSLTNYTIMQGSGYDFFLRDSICVYGYNVKDSEPTVLLNFVDSDISTSYFSSFISLDERTFIGTYYDYENTDDEASSSGLIISKYEKVNPEDVVEKQVITLGCLYLDSTVRKQIIDFNKKNDSYRIVVTDYSTYDTDEDYDAGSKRFNSDIASGKGPDIVIASDSSEVHNYISKGLYLDLTSYVESDPDISFDNLFSNIVAAGSQDGKFYEVIPSFFVQTVAGKTSVLKDITSWNMDEMKAFEATIPDGVDLFYGTTRDEFISSLLSVNASLFVDNTNGKCSFDSDEFKDLLEYAKKLPQANDEYYETLEAEGYWDNYDSLWRTGRVVLYPVTIYGFSDYNYLQKGYFGEDVTLVGYPSNDHSGSSIVYNFSLGISSKCKNPDGAWAFVREYLLDSYQKSINYAFPTSISAYDELAAKAQERKYYMDGGEKVYEDDEFYMNGEWIKILPATKEEIDKLTAFLKGVSKVNGSMLDIEEIITEEAEAFFEGQKSVDEVVKIIQSRASIFINEKR